MDFSKFIENVTEFSDREESRKSDGGGIKYRIVYPSKGKLRVRILFNPKSGLVCRLHNRHTINKNKIPCMATYTSKADCPVCQVLDEARNAGINVPYSMESRVRASMLAQYHSSSYEIEKVKKGDIIHLMVPWTVYKMIMKWMSDFATDPALVEKVFASNEYNVFIIERGESNQDWDARIDANVTIESAKDDESFKEMLAGLDSVYDIVNGIQETPTEDDIKLMTSVAQDLRNALLNPKVVEAPVNVINKESTNITNVVSNVSSVLEESLKEMNKGKTTPECYMTGNYVAPSDTNPSTLVQKIKCKSCPHKDDCSTQSSNAEDIPF